MAVNPKTHPNGFAALTAGSVASLVVVELHNRLGIDISLEEASFVVAVASAAIVFLGRKTGLDKEV